MAAVAGRLLSTSVGSERVSAPMNCTAVSNSNLSYVIQSIEYVRCAVGSEDIVEDLLLGESIDKVVVERCNE